jgi:serine protease Do
MADIAETRIVIRHLGGSKANQVEQIPLKGLYDILIGRDPGSTIAYDQKRDDVVSRKHATIRIEQGEGGRVAFRLADLNSSNGTFLNGERITGEMELAPDDTIELGQGGPKFAFDLQPRPDYMAARTRVMSAADAAATRAMAATTFETQQMSAPVASLDAGPPPPPPKPSVGKETVLRMLFQERKKSGRVLTGTIAAGLVLLAVIGGAFYWHGRTVEEQLRGEAADAAQRAQNQAMANVTQQLGATAKDIASRFSNSSVMIEVLWRMYDSQTGRPLFHKTVYDSKSRGTYPAFIKLPNNKIVRWLTLEDESRTNISIAKMLQGSGFVVSDQGLIMTNKHVAWGWMVPFTSVGLSNSSSPGFVYPYNMDQKKQKAELRALTSTELRELREWIPEEGAYVFEAVRPLVIGGDINNRRVFVGRNDKLEVRFPGNRMSVNAANVRVSTDADAAVIKVEGATGLRPVELAENDQVDVGDRVVVLGFPAVSQKTYTITQSNEAGSIHSRDEVVPETTVTEGIISLIGAGLRKEGEVTVFGSVGDAYQMSINSTGEGNSGGPVFNTKGRVIGLFTYGRSIDGDATVTFAVPIKHGKALLAMQRANAN